MVYYDFVLLCHTWLIFSFITHLGVTNVDNTSINSTHTWESGCLCQFVFLIQKIFTFASKWYIHPSIIFTVIRQKVEYTMARWIIYNYLQLKKKPWTLVLTVFIHSGLVFALSKSLLHNLALFFFFFKELPICFDNLFWSNPFSFFLHFTHVSAALCFTALTPCGAMKMISWERSQCWISKHLKHLQRNGAPQDLYFLFPFLGRKIK